MKKEQSIIEIESICQKDVTIRRNKTLIPYKIVFITEDHGLETITPFKTDLQQIAEIELDEQDLDFEYYQNHFSQSEKYIQKYELINRISGNGIVKIVILKPVNE